MTALIRDRIIREIISFTDYALLRQWHQTVENYRAINALSPEMRAEVRGVLTERYRQLETGE